jgi:hypothetical protein
MPFSAFCSNRAAVSNFIQTRTRDRLRLSNVTHSHVSRLRERPRDPKRREDTPMKTQFGMALTLLAGVGFGKAV